MPIVSGNEPPTKRKQPSLLGWILPLILFGPMISNAISSVTRGTLTRDQVMIGLIGLAILAAVGRRMIRSRGGSASPSTLYTPPTSTNTTITARKLTGYSSTSATTQARAQANKPYVPPPPRFEPMVSGKVMLLGLVLAVLFAGVGFFVLLAVG